MVAITKLCLYILATVKLVLTLFLLDEAEKCKSKPLPNPFNHFLMIHNIHYFGYNYLNRINFNFQIISSCVENPIFTHKP